ncbi:MOB1-like protein, partial [Dinothrombium tinctorium]
KARRKERDVSSSSSSQEESKQYLQMLECSAPEYKLREIVNLPDGLDYNEWLAYHSKNFTEHFLDHTFIHITAIAFFDHINLVYGTISEFCTMSGCPEMTGPGNRQYLWVDEKGKRFKLSSPQYIDYVMTYTQKTVNDESIFPTKFDKEFPSSFESVVKKILRLQFHVLAHIYHSHFKEIVLLNLHSHLNCIFAHLMMFNDRFKLVDEKEVEVLQDLAIALKLFPPIVRDDSVLLTPVTPEPASGFSPISTSEADYMNDKKETVITTQCRSISPFMNDRKLACKIQNPENPLPESATGSVQSQEVPLSDAKNCIFSKNVKDHPLTKLCNRKCTSASAVLLSCSSESPLTVQTTRRSNSSGATYHQTLGSVCGMNSKSFYPSSSVTATGSSPLKFQ